MEDMSLLEDVVLVPFRRSQRRVLIVAQQIELRARIARLLQSAGYTVELAGSRIRALELAAGKKIEAAIVVHSSDLNGLGQEINQLVPRTIMLSPPTDETCRSEHPPRGPEVPTQEFDEQRSSISSENRQHCQEAPVTELGQGPSFERSRTAGSTWLPMSLLMAMAEKCR